MVKKRGLKLVATLGRIVTRLVKRKTFLWWFSRAFRIMDMDMYYQEVIRRKFLKIGIFEAIPWSFKSDGESEWRGFCIDLIETLSQKMRFDYQLVVSTEPKIIRENNETKFTGIIKDLADGKFDMAVAALIPTAGGRDLVDFVKPYFQDSGISIVMRRPVRKSSFFKFMTVLDFDVWISLHIAIGITAAAFWGIEKLSPISLSKNYKKFTLKESLWFVVTTFASQGTGEIPRKLPHRILVASYWIFVLVMMTTFTANLAAFLTIERLQTPISSLWELTHQSRIKYTVVQDSHAHVYFKNMKFAEDAIFKIWTDIALSQTAENESEYETWDYPIKEEFRHSLSIIEQNNPVSNARTGFRMVLDNEKGEFALIHDTAEIRYHTYRDCRLVEVGEIFGERSYSIAVRKRSKLKFELQNVTLDLQEDRYFEALYAKYWSASNLLSCSLDENDSESITLESLGGVFIAVICGIILSLVTFMGEITYNIRYQKNSLEQSPLDYFFTINPSLKQNIINFRKSHSTIRSQKCTKSVCNLRSKKQFEHDIESGITSTKISRIRYW